MPSIDDAQDHGVAMIYDQDFRDQLRLWLGQIPNLPSISRQEMQEIRNLIWNLRPAKEHHKDHRPTEEQLEQNTERAVVFMANLDGTFLGSGAVTTRKKLLEVAFGLKTKAETAKKAADFMKSVKSPEPMKVEPLPPEIFKNQVLGTMPATENFDFKGFLEELGRSNEVVQLPKCHGSSKSSTNKECYACQHSVSCAAQIQSRYPPRGKWIRSLFPNKCSCGATFNTGDLICFNKDPKNKGVEACPSCWPMDKKPVEKAKQEAVMVATQKSRKDTDLRTEAKKVSFLDVLYAPSRVYVGVDWAQEELKVVTQVMKDFAIEASTPDSSKNKG